MCPEFLHKATVILTLVAFLPAGSLAQSEPRNSSNPRGRSSEVYKNIQVLRDTPSDELIPAMQFMTYSLGVECSYCHVEGVLDKDDKKPKLTARKMMQMMAVIDHDNFDGKQAVTCYSCHRGTPHPLAVPIVAEGGTWPAFRSEPHDNVKENPPAPDQIVAKYIEAVGGVSSISRIRSRKLTGSITLSGDSSP